MSSAPLRRADLDPDPMREFAAWYSQAADAVPTPEVVVLATADGERERPPRGWCC